MTFNLSAEELAEVGFASLGSDVRIDRRAALFNPSAIYVGSHVRVDAFAVLAGGREPLRIGSFVHVGASCYVSAGSGGIEIGDFTTLAPRVAVHGTSDDYLDGSLTGGIVPQELAENTSNLVRIGRHVIVGSGSVILPGVDLGEGAAVGSLTTVKGAVLRGAVVAGSPMRVVRQRVVERFEGLERKAWAMTDGDAEHS
jgi:dTDP-4-amino-4,6-dideoxy-D-glucose acyltransferase